MRGPLSWGNAALKAGDYDMALALYTEALTPSDSSKNRRMPSEVAGVLYSNRAAVKMLLDVPDPQGAAADAHAAAVLCPDWPKPRYRLAEAQLALGCYALAMKACRAGEAAATRAGDKSRVFDGLMDRVGMAAAREGSLAGFDGRVIYVRSAGEEAWLGKEAPENPAFDDLIGDQGGDGEDGGGGGGGMNGGGGGAGGADRSTRPLHARSMLHAMELAKDGDRIMVLRGIHNGLGHACNVTRRVLIRGEVRRCSLTLSNSR
jgi:hypothetical protein